MAKASGLAAILALLVFALDKYIKFLFLDGFVWHSDIISLYLVINKGVAFSMFAFLGESLKYIQVALVLALLVFVYREKEFFIKNCVAIGILFGAGCGNISDRFFQGGVVDYIAWHYGFEFAVFNFADIMINFAVFLIVLKMIFDKNNKFFCKKS
ncbi:MAG: signal peptidase II [Campylobacteraceae bacterium]|jgi:signal peptidase II|nr:signal peptidase II [Campylobacteraceae bacterium]